MQRQKPSTERKTKKKDSNNTLTKKLSGQYKDGSSIAKLFDVFSTAKDTDVTELAKLAGKGNAIVGSLSRLESDGNIGKELGSWIVSRRGRRVRIVIKANKPAAHMHLKRRPPSQAPNRQRRQAGSIDQAANEVSNQSTANDELQSRVSQ